MRLKDRVAIVVGAGQSPGEGIGNGRATALTFAREGAKVVCVDHNLASAQETVEIIGQNQGTAVAFKADITEEAFDRCVAINLKSCIFAARNVLPIMREQKRGVIINISSMAVITTYP